MASSDTSTTPTNVMTRGKSESLTLKKTLQETTYSEIKEFESISKLQTGAHVIGLMMWLTKPKPQIKSISKQSASLIVTQDLCKDWIAKNVYPISPEAAAKRILTTYEKFNYLTKMEKNDLLGDALQKEAIEFNLSMTSVAYDIRTRDALYQKKKLKSAHNIKMTSEDEKFYTNNCHGNYIFKCRDSVSAKWVKSEKRRLERQESIDRKNS